jgi:hypothetical protein
MMGLREITDGKRDTQLSEQNYAKRTTTSPREAKNMKNDSENRKNGLYEPENAIFGAFLMIFGAKRVKNSREKKKFGPTRRSTVRRTSCRNYTALLRST